MKGQEEKEKEGAKTGSEVSAAVGFVLQTPIHKAPLLAVPANVAFPEWTG